MIKVVLGDITKLEVDAIVNAANTYLTPGRGVDAAIRHAAGHELSEAMERLGGCDVGEARLTLGFHLRAKYVIHTVSPVWRGGSFDEAQALRSCYRSAFRVAMDKDLRSIAFPCIGTGAFGFPKQEAAEIAYTEIDAFEDRFSNVIICCFEQEDEKIYLELLSGARTGRW